MTISKSIVNIFLALTLSIGLSSVSRAQASDEVSADQQSTPIARPGERYQPSDDAMADLDEALAAARQDNKLVLVVMGGNWCHDSRALASRLQKQPLMSLVNESYETIFVDVGYLDKGKDVITSLGVPVYYATPTVLIVDPVSGQLLNAQNRHQWADANNISMEESVEYFRQFANTDPGSLQDSIEITAELQELLAEINAFEQLQADRLYEAYAVLGPMLEAFKNGEKDKFSDKYWNAVRDFRYKVPADVNALRSQAYERVAQGDGNIKLEYPKYRAFPWE